MDLWVESVYSEHVCTIRWCRCTLTYLVIFTQRSAHSEGVGWRMEEGGWLVWSMCYAWHVPPLLGIHVTVNSIISRQLAPSSNTHVFYHGRHIPGVAPAFHETYLSCTRHVRIEQKTRTAVVFSFWDVCLRNIESAGCCRAQLCLTVSYQEADHKNAKKACNK